MRRAYYGTRSCCRGHNLLDRFGMPCNDAWATSFISHTTVDCADAYTLSRWWQAVLDYVEDPDDPNEPGHEECMIFSRDRTHRLLFIEVPESKRLKNRIHFDLRPVEGSRDAELAHRAAIATSPHRQSGRLISACPRERRQSG